jgi:hypothetical protein
MHTQSAKRIYRLVKQRFHLTRTSLCQRCESLQLLVYIERPWECKPTLSATFEIASIPRDSINSSCNLCMQFAAFLHESTDDSSLTLTCIHAIKPGSIRVMNEFSMTFHPSARRVLLLPTKPLVFRSGDLEFPSLEYGCSWPEDVYTYIPSKLPLPSSSPDYEQLRMWLRKCYTEHEATCSIKQGHRLRPDRVIDCETQELCTNEEDYVCLSYVWGPVTSGTSAPAGTEKLGKILPRNLPRTIRDAMIVTLKIGQRYLWIDRYCIDQNNANEKHNIIRNMNAICKFPAYLQPEQMLCSVANLVSYCGCQSCWGLEV